MTEVEVEGRAPAVCPQCGTEIAPALLACPSCHRLVHGAELKRLAAAAEQATQAGDLSAALAGWRQALDLLPPDASQHQAISARIVELSRAMDSASGGSSRGALIKRGSSNWAKGTAGVSVL